LYDLRRYAEAEATLRKFLARDPQNALGHYYLSAALLAQSDDKSEKIDEGLKEAKKTISLRPDWEGGYFLLAWAHLCRRKPGEALDAAHQGLRIDPEGAWGYSLSAQAHAIRREWPKMLQAAQTGLKHSPDHTKLLNLQAEALIMLDRKDEARLAVEMALRSDPSSSYAHCNRGWLALFDGKPAEALPHFREAMRLDPASESARQGLLQSLHARNPLYRLMLAYFLWTSRLTHSEAWASIFILSGINRALRIAARAFPPLLIILAPYFILYMLFSFFTWVSEPLFNLLLRLSPTGRLILSKDESASAAGCGFTGMLFLINVIAFIAACIIHPWEFYYMWIFLLGAGLAFGMMVPVAGVFKVDPSRRKRRRTLVVLAALMGAMAACSWGGSFNLEPWHGVALFLFLIGWISYPLIANLIISIED
jgi:tetratricopeptide (TPR) repeat protein